MIRRTFVMSLVLVVSLSLSAHADESMDGASKDALEKTQQLLRDRTAREKAAQENTAASGAHSEVVKLGGAQVQDGVYDLSADVLKIAIDETGGDPVKLQAWIANAQKDPQGFLGSRLPAGSPARAKLENLAKQLEKK